MSNLVGTGGLVWLTVDERGGATEACLGGWGRVEEVVGGAVWANKHKTLLAWPWGAAWVAGDQMGGL